MFAIDCPSHGTKVLLGLGDIDSIDNTSRGIEVHYTCTCGHQGTWVTGRH